MQPGKVETTGKNVGGLVGFMHAYNRLNGACIHYTYAVVENSFATGEVIGSLNVGGLIGYGYRQNTYNHSYQNSYLQITNSYAIGKVTSSGEVGGLVGQLASTYYGSTTTTNSYWTPETTKQELSKAGTKKNIQAMLYKTGYVSWNFDSIWTIDEGTSVAYLRNATKPESVNNQNITYQAFGIEGRGTSLDPYIIKTAVQLQKVNENLDAYYKLGENIDLTGVEWTPIGNTSYPFKGTIDGNGFTISNLNINSSSTYQGLFGYNQGTIKNVKLDNITVTGTNYIAALAAYNTGTITSSMATNVNISGTNYIGGLVGYNTGIIDKSTTGGTVNGTSYIGGLVGYTIGNITGSISEAAVTGNDNIGGLIGYAYINNNNLTIESSGAKGNVTGVTNIGGLIGAEFVYHTYGAENVTYSMYVKKSYASGNVTGAGDNVGGLVGYQQSSINVSTHYENVYSYIQESYATRKS